MPSPFAADRLYIPVYAVTLLLSAFLLFLIQPMFGKMVLPLLGGAPSVWNTAMLFFQSLLLAGYAYAHLVSRFMTIKWQAGIHVVLLTVFTIVLPIAIPEGWVPPTGGNPAFWQLALMGAAVGGPFFVLSGSAPMLQHWFAHTKHTDAGNPYFLYAASNLGSMTALLAYPFLVEPALSVSHQAQLWGYGYLALIIMVAAAAFLVWKHGDIARDIRSEAKDAPPVTWKTRGTWLLLAFIPSSLMLGVTTFITTDLATVPLLWIIPLALYVGTFAIVFARKPVISRSITLKIHGILLIFFLCSLVFINSELNRMALVFLHLLMFFFTALMCHHELAAMRPHAGHLTQFYLFLSLGGALGGLFNALIAPALFVVPVEYGIVFVLSCFMRFISDDRQSFSKALSYMKNTAGQGPQKLVQETGLLYLLVIAVLCIFAVTFYTSMAPSLIATIAIAFLLPAFLRRRWILAFSALVIVCCNPPGYIWSVVIYDDVLHRDRNFFGIVRIVVDKYDETLSLMHGTTIHGNQAVAHKYKLEKLSYYSPHSGVSDAFKIADGFGTPQRIGVLGLGIGVTACYQKNGRHFDFFEIDPQVIEIAENPEFFTYLSDCGSPYGIIRGDARLTIQKQPDNHYDMILMDAFSSDNIPVHLITYEALQLYRSKLKEKGFILVNISNRYLNLKPVLARAAEEMGMTALVKYTHSGTMDKSGLNYKAAEFVIITAHEEQVNTLRNREWVKLAPQKDKPLWTDQYSNIVSVLKTGDMFKGEQ